MYICVVKIKLLTLKIIKMYEIKKSSKRNVESSNLSSEVAKTLSKLQSGEYFSVPFKDFEGSVDELQSRLATMNYNFSKNHPRKKFSTQRNWNAKCINIERIK